MWAGLYNNNKITRISATMATNVQVFIESTSTKTCTRNISDEHLSLFIAHLLMMTAPLYITEKVGILSWSQFLRQNGRTDARSVSRAELPLPQPPNSRRITIRACVCVCTGTGCLCIPVNCRRHHPVNITHLRPRS